LKIREQHYGSDHPELATLLMNFGVAYLNLRNHKKARVIHERLLPLLEMHYGLHNISVAKTLTNLGIVKYIA